MKRVVICWQDGERQEYRCDRSSWDLNARNLALLGVADTSALPARAVGDIVIPLANVRWFKEDDRG